eukprot:scaffold230571_cov35-Tisochrysis_lutea.AAC.2
MVEEERCDEAAVSLPLSLSLALTHSLSLFCAGAAKAVVRPCSSATSAALGHHLAPRQCG